MTGTEGDQRLVRPGIGTSPDGEEAQWYRWFFWFDLAFGGISLIAIITAFVDPGVSLKRAVAGSGAAIFLTVWYRLRGRWGRIRRDRDALVYFALVIPVIVLALRMYDGFGLLLFAAYWQGFAILRTMPALIYAAVLTIAMQIGYSTITFSTLDEIHVSPYQIIIGVVLLTVSGMMALYMESLAREMDRRQHLLDELKTAQANLAEQEREAGMRLERERFSAEIHDTIAQQFTSVVTNLTAAKSRGDRNPDAALHHIDAALTAARQGITDARRMVAAMQPDVLTGRTISEALREISSSGPASPVVSFTESGVPGSLTRFHEAILVRALQEALGNTRKHAGATTVDVTLTWEEDDMILDISDDGCGFDPDGISPREDGFRMGLWSMRARVEGAGGTWMLESVRREGTSLAISFPLSRPEEGEP
ncbi:MAG TPA: sensor histidine kinase [Thermomicrobiales bacterium]|nr:sensor histidine kinase [Thermomicrobiales bacterium]